MMRVKEMLRSLPRAITAETIAGVQCSFNGFSSLTEALLWLQWT